MVELRKRAHPYDTVREVPDSADIPAECLHAGVECGEPVLAWRARPHPVAEDEYVVGELGTALVADGAGYMLTPLRA